MIESLVTNVVEVAISVAHRLPYGDRAVEIATSYIISYQKYSVKAAAAQAHALKIAQAAVARGDQISVYPDWCDHGSRLLASVCEQYLDAPIWSTVLILDGVALWLIICILWRQREQNREDREARLAPPRDVRVQRMWRIVGAATRFTSHVAKNSAKRSGITEMKEFWAKSWEEVAKARKHRREYLWKKDYDLMGVMGRGIGPCIMLGCTVLILYETHGWYTLVVPTLRLPSRCRLLVGWVTAVVPFRILLDYFRTSFTDPGRPQAISPRGGAVVSQGQKDGDIELGGPAASDVKRCKRCAGPKPSRCHHCKVCRRCVLKMDHHCPFVNNCVGLRNHRFFIMFLFELVVGCTTLVVCLLPLLLESLRGAPHQTLANRIHVITVFAVALIADSMLAPFFYFHMQLVVMNETTLENMKSRNDRVQNNLKQRQLQRALEKAEKVGQHDEVEKLKHQQAAESERAAAQEQATAEEKLRHSRGSFIENFSEVFGAPPAPWRKRVEALLEWFNPAPAPSVKKRSA